MEEYLLDTNVVIGLWKQYPFVINKLVEENKIKILEAVSQELVVKERREYKGIQVLSERFCKLLPFVIEVDRGELKEFYSMLNIKYSQKGNTYFNTDKLSENDLLLLYTCYLDDNLILVTEDKYIFHAANIILGKERVIGLRMLIEIVLREK
jgi:predicted nucleic acid-binding protein